VLPRCNESIVPFKEQEISIYVRLGVFLALYTGLGDFINNEFSNPGGPQCANACGFLRGIAPKETAPAWKRAEAVRHISRLGNGSLY
jgi:hypothetical protein